MDPERWQNLVDLFTRARESGPQQRATILAEAESTDPSLRAELEAMLREDYSGEDPLPALQAPLLPAPTKWIGRYRLLSRLGAGGMGVIYLAEDPTLKRTVAIKLLLTHSLGDDAAGARLLREARAAAALHHANICPIYEINESDGYHYIVMAALEGENLAQYLSGHGPLSSRAALDIAVQIAKAMQAAHDKDIFHRDIKPANVFITPLTRGGVQVTLLDFGLAQGKEMSRVTRDGAIAGTLSYMSPEQTRGKAADARSDIWSFGVVLYEMLAGTKPFEGPDAVMLQAIQNDNPHSLRSKVKDIPPALDRLVLRALSKDPEHRQPSAGELLDELLSCQESLTPSSSNLSINTATPKQPSIWTLGAIITLISATIGAALWFYAKPKPATTATNEALQFRKITERVPENRVTATSIHPDGQSLIFTDLKGDIYTRDLRTGFDRILATLPGQEVKLISRSCVANTLLFSAVALDGDQLSLWLMTEGGTPTRVASNARDGALSPDCTSIAYLNDSSSEVWVTHLTDNKSRRIASDSTRESFLFVHWLDDGQSLAYAQRVGVSTGASVAELRTYQPTNYPWRYRIFDLQSNTVKATKSDVRMLFPSPMTGNRFSFLTWTRTIPTQYSLEQVEIDSKTANFRVLKSTPIKDNALNISTSRNGDKVASLLPSWQNEIYVSEINAASQAPNRITFDNSNEYPHAWTPDEDSIIFESERSGHYTLYKQRLTERIPTKLVEDASIDVVPQTSPDGKWILFLRKPKSDSPYLIYRIPMAGGKAEAVPNVGPFDEFRCTGAKTKAGAKDPGARGRCVVRSVSDSQFIFHELDPLTGKGRELTRCPWSRFLFGDWSLSFSGSFVALPDHDRIPSVIRVINLDNPGQGANQGDYEVTLKDAPGIGGLAWTADDQGWIGGFMREIEKPTIRLNSGDLRYIDKSGRSRVITQTVGLSFGVPAPSGKRFAFVNGIMSSNVWLADLH